MINRFYLEEYLSFDKVELEFQKGLIVFSGASGTGKSILMSSILSLFGQTDAKSKLSEISIENIGISDESYSIEQDDEFIIKQNTSSKTRYFLNSQSIPKKNLNIFCKSFFKHLHLKDTSDFDSLNIIGFLDFLSSNQLPKYKDILSDFNDSFKLLKEYESNLKKVLQDEKNIEDLKSFVTYEIEKITSVNPQEGEYEELKSLKDIVSKKDKIEEIIEDAKPFLNNTHKVSAALNILDIDSSFFDDAMNEVNSSFEQFYDKLENIEDVNVEETLDRIEELSRLIKKHGSINEALVYKKEKEKELEKYEHISFEKAILEKNIKKLSIKIENLADEISIYREKSLLVLQKDMNQFLEFLYLENLNIHINKTTLNQNGQDEISFTLNNISLNKISSGEFNRLRLALLTARSIYEINKNGILFLDEIDANLSGKESESIAKVLNVLSNNYQIFAISHQPQLSATAHQHFLVYKEEKVSKVKLMNKDERISEISRMISGEDITEEATKFAKKLLDN